MEPGPEKGRTGRLVTACVECSRRKQKCSRDWPCDNCQARKVPHLCHFKSVKKDPSSDDASSDNPVTTTASKKRKDVAADTTSDHDPIIYNEDIPDTNEGLKAFGYMPDHAHFSLGRKEPITAKDWFNQLQESPPPSKGSTQHVEVAVRVLPGKAYIDTLVQCFLQVPNYHYYSIYPPHFRDQYSKWWTDRLTEPNAAFTCLLLRICACSVQYLDINTKKNIQFELGEKIQDLTERLHAAAQTLSATITPGSGGLDQVQQLFLTATWYKGEARFTESWHALCAAIREAQELGIDKNATNLENISEFDMDMRRRVWCILYTWDWQMGALLSRPLIINQSTCIFKLPNLQLESSTLSSPPSPFIHTALQCELCRDLYKKYGVMSSMTIAQVLEVWSDVNKWIDSFPPHYLVQNPDTQWDELYPHVRLQRYQLHVMAFSMLGLPMKPYLAKSMPPHAPADERKIRSLAVDCYLQLMISSRQFFDAIWPIDVKFHYVIFSTFDCSIILCSAITHDHNWDLPKRPEVIEALRNGLDIMSKLGTVTRTGAMSYGVLKRLVEGLPLTNQERLILNVGTKRIRTTALSSASSSEVSDHVLTPSDKSLTPPPLAVVLPPTHTHAPSPIGDLMFNLPLQQAAATAAVAAMPIAAMVGAAHPPLVDGLEYDPMQFPPVDLAEFDLNDLPEIWDWRTLDLDLNGMGGGGAPMPPS